ncbi:hypothetical protein SISNIDRAFT_458240 [Sistotremastrum niveocremeum HHB9708]|uniref:FHF complex subunit HOOK-interacting protein C-terminal domain-containing protein n=1 Tax=Sistotremastrum niveocremeum HHB9708 TaxID=1314777 RepID=A0A164QSI4_9AGAM|nr:hypothetical protein SISNIDRAFT_458240 [Sistotremastrum niveocremeum HHB9708]
MNYFSQFLRSAGPSSPKPTPDQHLAAFHNSWTTTKNTLLYPDERQLSRGIQSTDVPAHLKSMTDTLVWESTRSKEGTTGACLEYLLKNDVLGTLVKLSEADRPSGIQAEVLRSVSSMVVLLDEQFLVHTAVHRPVLRLLRTCVGDELEEKVDGRGRVVGAASNTVKPQPSEYEEDLVDLLCTLCSRIRTYRELLMIFFYDKHYYQSQTLFSVEEDEENSDEEEESSQSIETAETIRSPSPAGSQATITSAPTSASAPPHKPEYEFLLFNYLLRFVHREGRIGDYARAGLLFLMDVAMSAGEPTHKLDGEITPTASLFPPGSASYDPVAEAALALAEYILEGDFSDVLAAGLSAVYSLLPSKLEIRAESDDATGPASMRLGRDDSQHSLDAEPSSSPEFRSRLEHFIKLTDFIQDVLRENNPDDVDGASENHAASARLGSAIVQSILQAIRRVFLENVMYPSILECSDLDGSAVAVMSYIEVMLRCLHEGPLVDSIIEFLMSEEDDLDVSRRRRSGVIIKLGQELARKSRKSKKAGKDTKLKRRKSSAMILLEREAPEAQHESEYFKSLGRFTLKDLLLANLSSDNAHAATAALNLLQTVTLYHCPISVDKLFTFIPLPHATQFTGRANLAQLFEDSPNDAALAPMNRGEELAEQAPALTFLSHERELRLYLSLVSRVDPQDGDGSFSTGFAHYLHDAIDSLCFHRCYQHDIDENPQFAVTPGHRLDTSDTILSLTLHSLRAFFSHPPDYNLALTGMLVSLALCPSRSLAGWLTLDTASLDLIPSDLRSSEPIYDDEDDRSVDYDFQERFAMGDLNIPASSLDQQSFPLVHTILSALISQIDKYRIEVDDFDRYLTERRQGLLFSENLNDALNVALDRSTELDGSSSKPSLLSASVSTPPTTPSRPKAKSKTSSFMSFLTPTKSKSTSKPNSPPTSQTAQVPGPRVEVVATTPFIAHYQSTSAIKIEPLLVPRPADHSSKVRAWDTTDDVFAAESSWGGQAEHHESFLESAEKKMEEKATSTSVTLSQLLDNVVILEECIKELAAIIQARKCLGIDALRYV